MDFKNKLILAPMAGVTDIAFRILARRNGADIVISEFISAEAIVRENQKTIEMIRTSKDESPVGIQLFGTELESIAKATRILSQDKNLAFIDFNFGCPSHKITCTGAGGALLDHPEKIGEIVRTIVQNTHLPVTSKMRINPNKEITIKIAKEIEKAGAKALTVHARTVSQGYSGNADWEILKEIKQNISIPLIGNGDVRSLEDYKKIKETGVDSVMIGRAAMNNPNIFNEIKQYEQTTKEKKLELVKDYITLAKENNLNNDIKTKQHIMWLTKGLENSSKIREQVSKLKSIDEIMQFLNI